MTENSTDKEFMGHALRLAREAESVDEVPVGAVVVLNDEIIGEGYNRPITTNDPTAHAEIVAMRDAAQRVGNYRLVNATLYVTLEPCVMCMGAITHARIAKLVYGATDPKAGAVESIYSIVDDGKLNHVVETQGGVLAEECGQMLTDFFRRKRAKS